MTGMKPRILIVDDDSDLLELLRNLLEGLGCVVRTVTSGEAALEQAVAFTPDLIVLDLLLPQMNGFTVCERLRALLSAATTPVIMMTSLIGEFPRLEGLHCGCNAFITKPFQIQELLAQVEKLLPRPLAPPAAATRSAAGGRHPINPGQSHQG